MIITWIRNGLLVRKVYHSATDRKDREGLYLRRSKTTGMGLLRNAELLRHLKKVDGATMAQDQSALLVRCPKEIQWRICMRQIEISNGAPMARWTKLPTITLALIGEALYFRSCQRCQIRNGRRSPELWFEGDRLHTLTLRHTKSLATQPK